MLDKRIVEKLSKVLRKKPGTIKKDVSLLGEKYPNSTTNARAQIYAVLNGTTVRRFLKKEDKASLPTPLPTVAPQRYASPRKGTKKRERITHFIRYETTNPFRLAHIEEANRAYTYKCYTSAFILCRKIIENIVADILQAKFPPNTKENKELYFDIARGRTRDFKELLASLKTKKADFEMDKRLVEKILTEVEPFKEEADRKTHSWYHIVKNRAEIDKMNTQNMFDLLHELEERVATDR